MFLATSRSMFLEKVREIGDGYLEHFGLSREPFPLTIEAFDNDKAQDLRRFITTLFNDTGVAFNDNDITLNPSDNVVSKARYSLLIPSRCKYAIEDMHNKYLYLIHNNLEETRVLCAGLRNGDFIIIDHGAKRILTRSYLEQ